MNITEMSAELEAIEQESQEENRKMLLRISKLKNKVFSIPNLEAKLKDNSFTAEENALIDEYNDLRYFGFLRILQRKHEKETALKEKAEKKSQEISKLIGNNDYLPVRQGIATNKLSKVKSRKEDFEVDGILKRAKSIQKVGQDTITVMIENFSDKSRLRASTHKLLTALLIEFTETNGKDTTITLPLKKYMEMRGLTNEVAARRQVNEDLDLLYSISLSITYGSAPKNAKERKSRRNYIDMRLVTKKGIKNGIITCTFANEFYEALKSYTVMPITREMLALDDKHSPHAFYFLKFMSEYMNMNYFKTNKNVISVASLLASSPEMPTHEEIQAQNRHYKERIIKPFEDTLNTLQDMNIITWHYVKPIADDWESFIKAEIYFELVNYPTRESKEKNSKKA